MTTTIAVPMAAGDFSPHFGGADSFALFEVDTGTGAAGPHRLAAPPEHGRGVYPMWLSRQGVNVVLAGGMGSRAAGILASQGIEVVLGITSGGPRELVHRYLAGDLATSGELCHEHGLHDCGHHDHDDHHRGHGLGHPGGGT